VKYELCWRRNAPYSDIFTFRNCGIPFDGILVYTRKRIRTARIHWLIHANRPMIYPLIKRLTLPVQCLDTFDHYHCPIKTLSSLSSARSSWLHVIYEAGYHLSVLKSMQSERKLGRESDSRNMSLVQNGISSISVTLLFRFWPLIK